MNEEPKNKITDQQLDDMLRDVRVPGDLKERLLQIPHAVQQDQSLVQLTDVATSDQKQTRWLPYVLAATLLILAGIAATQWPANNQNTPDVTAKQDSNPDNSPNDESPTNELTEYQAKLAAYEAEIQRLELEQANTEQLLAQSAARSYLDPNDISSMIMALAPEYSQELGGTKMDIKTEMALVLDEFPQTRGAELAEQMLERLN